MSSCSSCSENCRSGNPVTIDRADRAITDLQRRSDRANRGRALRSPAVVDRVAVRVAPRSSVRARAALGSPRQRSLSDACRAADCGAARSDAGGGRSSSPSSISTCAAPPPSSSAECVARSCSDALDLERLVDALQDLGERLAPATVAPRRSATWSRRAGSVRRRRRWVAAGSSRR